MRVMFGEWVIGSCSDGGLRRDPEATTVSFWESIMKAEQQESRESGSDNFFPSQVRWKNELKNVVSRYINGMLLHFWDLYQKLLQITYRCQGITTRVVIALEGEEKKDNLGAVVH